MCEPQSDWPDFTPFWLRLLTATEPVVKCMHGKHLHLEPDATTLPREARANVLAVLPVHSQIALLNNSSEERSFTKVR